MHKKRDKLIGRDFFLGGRGRGLAGQAFEALHAVVHSRRLKLQCSHLVCFGQTSDWPPQESLFHLAGAKIAVRWLVKDSTHTFSSSALKLRCLSRWIPRDAGQQVHPHEALSLANAKIAVQNPPTLRTKLGPVHPVRKKQRACSAYSLMSRQQPKPSPSHSASWRKVLSIFLGLFAPWSSNGRRGHYHPANQSRH